MNQCVDGITLGAMLQISRRAVLLQHERIPQFTESIDFMLGPSRSSPRKVQIRRVVVELPGIVELEVGMI